MRLDKYLKITRLIKRRTVANEACDGGRILVNGKVARASYAVKEGDTIEIQMGNRPLKVQVLSVSEYATKESAPEMYGVEEYPLPVVPKTCNPSETAGTKSIFFRRCNNPARRLLTTIAKSVMIALVKRTDAGWKNFHHIILSIKLNSLIKSDRGDRPCEVRQPAKRQLCKVPNPAG